MELLDAEVAWVSEFDKHPSTILAQRFPDAPNLGDITKIDWAKIEPVDVITGGSPCFPAGTLIDTIQGYLPIEEIRLGDMVRTHKERYMPVIQLMEREAHDTLAVKVMGTPEFTTTKEHPFWVRTKGQTWNNTRRQYDRNWSTPHWTPAENLTTNDFVGFQLDQPNPDTVPLGVPLSYIVGRWLGDGWVRNGKRASSVPQGTRGSRVNSTWWQVFICCAHGEAAELEKKFNEAGLTPARFDTRTVTKFRLNSKPLTQMLNEFGKGAAGKKIPGWVYQLPTEDQHAIWQGWADADGSVQSTGQVRVTTVSEELAHGMARIGRNVFKRALSVHKSEMPPTCVIEGRTVNQRDQYQVVLPVRNRQAFVEGNWCWSPVRSVREMQGKVHVFNFGVQDDESYTAWGITVHNCQDLSHAGQRAGMKDGTRSGLWVNMLEAIKTIRPKLVVWENVGGAFSACATTEADSDLGPCPRCVDPSGRVKHAPNIRALGRVLGDLTEAGYDAEWHSVRAADIGAPHGRLRVFVTAWPRETGKPKLGGRALTYDTVGGGSGESSVGSVGSAS